MIGPNELPIVTNKLNPGPPEYTYDPREGDVIQRGRVRRVVHCDCRKYNGNLSYSEHQRKLFSGEWVRVANDTMAVDGFAALVGAMGWTLVARKALEQTR